MDWRIANHGRTCERCGAQFPLGAQIISGIFDNPDGFVRRDFCAACWSVGDDVFSFWKHTIPEPQEPKLADRFALMGIFRNLAGAKEDRKRDFRYVLALALMRRRALKPVSSRTQAGAEIMLLRHPRDESLHEVEVRPISGERVQMLVAEVTRIISVPGADPTEPTPKETDR